MFQRTAPRESLPPSPALYLSKYAAEISTSYLKEGVTKVCSTAKLCQLRFQAGQFNNSPYLGLRAVLPFNFFFFFFCALRWRLLRAARVMLSRGPCSRRPISGPYKYAGI